MSVEDLVDSFERDQTDGILGPSHSLTKILAHAVKYYGVSPLFKVIRLEKDKFAVSFFSRSVKILSSKIYLSTCIRNLYEIVDALITKRIQIFLVSS